MRLLCLLGIHTEWYDTKKPVVIVHEEATKFAPAILTDKGVTIRVCRQCGKERYQHFMGTVYSRLRGNMRRVIKDIPAVTEPLPECGFCGEPQTDIMQLFKRCAECGRQQPYEG